MRGQQDIGLCARRVPGLGPLEQCHFGLLDPLYNAKESFRRTSSIRLFQSYLMLQFGIAGRRRTKELQGSGRQLADGK
jgi:hypothetical protein